MIYSLYNTYCWAENKCDGEIWAEIQRLKNPRDFTNNCFGNAHMDYVRIEALKEILKERVNHVISKNHESWCR